MLRTDGSSFKCLKKDINNGNLLGMQILDNKFSGMLMYWISDSHRGLFHTSWLYHFPRDKIRSRSWLIAISGLIASICLLRHPGDLRYMRLDSYILTDGGHLRNHIHSTNNVGVISIIRVYGFSHNLNSPGISSLCFPAYCSSKLERRGDEVE